MAKKWMSIVDVCEENKRIRKRMYRKSSLYIKPSRKKLFKKPKSSKKTKAKSSQENTGIAYLLGIIFVGYLLYNYFWTILLVLIAIGIIATIVYGIYISKKEEESQNEICMQQQNAVSLEIERLFEIIEDSQNLVNNSADIETVKTRLDLLLITVKKVMEYTEVDLNKANKTKATLQEQYDFIVEKYDIVINQAIERAFEQEKENADILKTDRGKANRLHRFFEKIKNIEWLTENNKKFINEFEVEKLNLN